MPSLVRGTKKSHDPAPLRPSLKFKKKTRGIHKQAVLVVVWSCLSLAYYLALIFLQGGLRTVHDEKMGFPLRKGIKNC